MEKKYVALASACFLRQNFFVMLFFALIYFSAASTKIYADENISVTQKFSEHTLENSMSVFVVEDEASALIRIELAVRAGYSAQEKTTTGFFPLYVRLFSNSGKETYYEDDSRKKNPWLLENMSADCMADSASFVLTVTADQTYDALEQLAACAMFPVFLDSEIEAEYGALKREISSASSSATGLINAGIDSRIFDEAPWKQESGIYPELFSSKSTEEARAELFRIAKNFYAPNNSALFISGCITKAGAVDFVKSTFGTWKASARMRLPAPHKTGEVEKDSYAHASREAETGARKFVLHSPDFSADITQLVIQYTSLGPTEADVAAAVFMDESSSFKSSLLAEPNLAIRGAEYIDAAAIHRRGSDRLIIQSILEQSQATPAEQVELFANTIRHAISNTTSAEMDAACKKLTKSYGAEISDTQSFMHLLSGFWATVMEEPTQGEKHIAAQLASRPQNIAGINYSDMYEKCAAETPFVFAIVNSGVYKTYGKQFASLGYEPITSSNSSWYLREPLTDMEKREGETVTSADTPNAAFPNFAAVNKAAMTTTMLANKIPVVVKQNNIFPTVAIALAISGGSLYTSDNPGFNEMMVDALAENILREIEKKQRAGKIFDQANVYAQTNLSQSIIIIECQSQDATECIACITDALIYGEIRPALADGLISNRRTQQILKEGSLSHQLSRSAISYLYPETDYEKIYTATSPILSRTTYEEILDAYPLLLNPSRYSVAVVGRCFPEMIVDALSKSLGLLYAPTEQGGMAQNIESPKFDGPKKITAQLVHRFFSDISADRAGPRPSVLVPTTVFNDPVQYWLMSPEPDSADFALFNALAYELCARMNTAAKANPQTERFNISVSPAGKALHAAVFTVANVSRRNLADAIYAQAALSLLNDLTSEDPDAAVAAVKNSWALNALTETSTNRGTALLLAESFLYGGPLESTARYLSDYEEIYGAANGRFSDVFLRYVPGTAPLAVYSADTPQ